MVTKAHDRVSACLPFAFGAGLYVSSPTYPPSCVLLSAASSLLETSSHSSLKTGSVLPDHLVPWAWTGACVLTDGWLLPDVQSALG